MTQEDKEILFVALCGYYPYGVIVKVIDVADNEYTKVGKLLNIDKTNSNCNGTPFLFRVELESCLCDITEIKPYLRPMFSMTEEEKKEIEASFSPTGQELFSLPYVDWLNKNHFDYRGLIEKGLALEAPDRIYNVNKK